jgi:hypothetical protein
MQEQANGLIDTGKERSVLDQVGDLLGGMDARAEGHTVNNRLGDRLLPSMSMDPVEAPDVEPCALDKNTG